MEKRPKAFVFLLTIACLLCLANCKLYSIVPDVGPTFEPNGCDCSDNMCGCCQDIELEVINGTGCVNFTYLPDDVALQLTMSWDGKVYINKTISAKNPPPLCQGLPLVNACVKFYNMSYTEDHLGGCVEFVITLIEKVEIPIGCFYFPNQRGLALAREIKKNSEELVGKVKERVTEIRREGLTAAHKAKDYSKELMGKVKEVVDGNIKEGLAQAYKVKDRSQEMVEKMKELVTTNLGGLTSMPSDPCQCNKTACGCCAEIPVVGGKVCVNVTELPKEEALRFTLSLDGKILINETLSAENPPPFCESDVTHLAYICVRFYNMSYSGKIGGCLQLECRVLEKFNISMGCFYFPDNPSDVLTEGRTGVKKILDNHVKEAQKTLKNLLGIIKEAPVLSEPDSKPSVARDKVVLSEEMCKCRPGKTIDCRCCAPVTDSQACLHLNHPYQQPKMAVRFTVHGSKSNVELSLPFSSKPCSYWRFEEKNLRIRLCYKAASRDLGDGSAMSGMCLDMETREPKNYKKYSVGCVYPVVEKKKSVFEKFLDPIGWLG